MTRRHTASSMIWPNTPDGAAMALRWAEDNARTILDWTWRAFDILFASKLSKVDLTQPLEQLERNLVSLHFVEINILYACETGGFSAVTPTHEWPEMETLSSAKAKPPAYDLAFVADNRRWAWPIEAKVIPTPGTLAEYMKDVNDKFVAGIACPLIGEGAMIAYLLTGDGLQFIKNLESALGQDLAVYDGIPDRLHKTSEHSRNAKPDLRLHHLVMKCTATVV